MNNLAVFLSQVNTIASAIPATLPFTDKILDALLIYGPLGVIAFLFIWNNQQTQKAVMDQFKFHQEESRKYYESKERSLDTALNAFRAGLEVHNQKTIEYLTGLENRIGTIDNINVDNFDELHKINHSLNEVIDELHCVVTEIKFVCPSRSRRQLGDILVEQGFVRETDLKEALEIQKDRNKVG